MFEIVFLGTSAAAPTVHRGLTAQMILAQEHRFLLDCGEGTQRQILQSGLGFKKLDKILLTHPHLDHILGLGGLASTLTRWENLSALHIWASEATLERVQNLLYGVVFLRQEPPIALNFYPLQKDQVFFQDKKFTLSAFPVRHQGVGSFGFLFQERSRRPFLAEKADALGVPNGAERGRLVAGQALTLADGRVIQPDDVLGETQEGVKLVYVGDCGSTDNLGQVADNADCLVMESTYLDAEAQLAKEFGHMTAGGAARFARAAGVKTLILNHVSRRHRAYELRQEAQAIFPETYVARDFDHFILSKKGVERRTSQADSQSNPLNSQPERLPQSEGE
jgi:ribonuclease Z